jgi:uncharacterized protein (UPF0332 family)
MMNDEAIRGLSLYRLEKAADELDTAEIDFAAGKYNAAANRAYYAIFHIIRAVLALDGVDFKKHSGVIGYFQKEYLSTDTIDRTFSELIKKAFVVRNASDYSDYYETTQEEAKYLIDQCDIFRKTVVTYILRRLDE